MAKSRGTVSLGYPDEYITDRHINSVDFTTNKIGGNPDSMTPTDVLSPSCKLCGLKLVLVTQLYAPLENSQYHRGLYVFACINSTCWNDNQSWICIRHQKIDETYVRPNSIDSESKKNKAGGAWCADSDDWGSDEDDFDFAGSGDDENGNLAADMAEMNIDLDVTNENNGATSISPVGAIGTVTTPVATAEIEGDENEIVEMETPVSAQVNVVSLLQNVMPVPQMSSDKFQFIPLFLNFEEETFDTSPDGLGDHINILIQNYNKSNPVDNALSPNCSDNASGENYEKGIPAHGDKIFHRFMTRVRRNPGQVVRFCRDNAAVLWMHTVENILDQCKYCKSPLIFEVQLLSTLIPHLHLQLSSNGSGELGHLEFGCVYIFTCSANCWNQDDVWREELVVLQSEMY